MHILLTKFYNRMTHTSSMRDYIDTHLNDGVTSTLIDPNSLYTKLNEKIVIQNLST